MSLTTTFYVLANNATNTVACKNIHVGCWEVCNLEPFNLVDLSFIFVFTLTCLVSVCCCFLLDRYD